LRVVRQVRTGHDDVIDLVLFLNGIPVATVEIKTDFTQDVNAAVDQYRFDRIPRPKGKPFAEPLLDFPRGALVHFALSNRTVLMTTRLQGPATQFLPFNQGDHGAAGNPPNAKGHRTHYLWEQVWERDSWLEIIGRYLVTRRDSKKKITGGHLPALPPVGRHPQAAGCRADRRPGPEVPDPAQRGSGKTNSIAWTAHFLADLHDAQHQQAVRQRAGGQRPQRAGRAVAGGHLRLRAHRWRGGHHQGGRQSKSAELAEALSGGKKIVVCTIQTFPFALKAVQDLAATHGKRFAVIADEAHSSQTGDAAAKLKQVLNAEELKELADGGEVSTEDLLAAQMANRAAGRVTSGITYVAFTATPKAKTLELFGRRPHPDQPAGPDNLPPRSMSTPCARPSRRASSSTC
jgi:type I restriction enzyme R subunit